MAFCPKCGRAMGAMEPACPSCGYDFPAAGDGTTATGQAAPADPATVALVAGSVGAGLAAAWAALKAVAAVVQGEGLTAAAALVASLLLVGLCGLFLRARGR